jgi:signal transduction histidine kinase
MKIAVIVLSVLLINAIGIIFFLYKKLKQAGKITKKTKDLSEAGILASGLAHEIRNPLNSIKINVQLLQEDIEDAIEDEELKNDFRETISSITYEIGRLNELMTNFLTYARPTQLQKEDFNLSEFLSDMVNFMKVEAENKGIAIEYNFPADELIFNGDRQKLRQSFMNILKNAIQILGEGGKVKITLKNMRDLYLIEIEDNGPGMTEEFLKQIFVAFSSQRKGGTGLGLSIAKKFIDAHGGGIKVESKVGVGTKFTIILPAGGNASLNNGEENEG